MFPLVREMAATGTQFRVSVVVACRVLGFSKQAYYQWLADPFSDRDWADAHLINAARDVWKEDPCLGYRLIADELREDGITASERRVWGGCAPKKACSRPPTAAKAVRSSVDPALPSTTTS